MARASPGKAVWRIAIDSKGHAYFNGPRSHEREALRHFTAFHRFLHFKEIVSVLTNTVDELKHFTVIGN